MRDERYQFPYREPDILNRFADLLGKLKLFHAHVGAMSGNQIARTEFLTNVMFGHFQCPDTPPFPLGAAPIANLDTGDPAQIPYPPFTDALRLDADKLTYDAYHYYNTDAAPELEDAFRKFAEHQGLSDLIDPAMHLLPSAGTVQGYDVACRALLQRPGDTVAVPQLGYGFSLTQPARMRGRVTPIPCGSDGGVNVDALAQKCGRETHRLWESWRRRWRDEALINLSYASEYADDLDADRLAALIDAAAPFCEAPEAWREDALQQKVIDAGREVGVGLDPARLIGALRPPVIRAYLHIQPAVSGHIHRADEHERIRDVLSDLDIPAIEDVAYHSIRCELAALPRLSQIYPNTITLLGLSKPMGLVNFRLGIMVAPERHFNAIRYCGEASIGFVSSVLQRALAHALNESTNTEGGYRSYAQDMNTDEHGYEDRFSLFSMLCFGPDEDASPRTRDWARALVEECAASDASLAARVDDFLQQGLGAWFRPFNKPEAGFFQLVSCEPLLERPVFRRAGLASSFDVFALLSYLFDLRTIPEEAMGPNRGPGRVLRMSFSPYAKSMAHRLFFAYVGLSDIEDQQGAAAAGR